jgi:hypothetical protein
MVVMFVDCCVGVYGIFRTIPTVEIFVPARTLIVVFLLTEIFKYMLWAYFLDYRGNVCAPLD